MNFAVNKTTNDALLSRYAALITGELVRKGHTQLTTNDKINFVIHLTDIDVPTHYKRKAQDEFIVTLVILREKVEDIRSVCFITLIKTLSNFVLCIVPNGNPRWPDVFYITPEVGFVKFRFVPSRVYQCLLPIVGSHFVLGNKITTDLPISGEVNHPEIRSLVEHAHKLGKLGHLPIPFPIQDYLDEEKIRHLFRMYEIKGLSYGNLSVRNMSEEREGISFWMTARGTDKAHLQRVGQDILLVTGFDEQAHLMEVSVPPDYDPRVRVSVDAVEHYLIYSAFPEVGAIVHIHAWIDGVVSTTQNFPCGTYELAKSVTDLLKQTDHPERTEVGLKNHGLTITGANLPEIFERIKNRIKINVPMFE